MIMPAADLPTNQSPPATSIGEPFREYGWRVVPMIGQREKKAKPAPRAPLGREGIVSGGEPDSCL